MIDINMRQFNEIVDPHIHDKTSRQQCNYLALKEKTKIRENHFAITAVALRCLFKEMRLREMSHFPSIEMKSGGPQSSIFALAAMPIYIIIDRRTELS